MDDRGEVEQLRATTALALGRLEGALAEAVALRALLEDAQQRLAAARCELLDEREANRSRWERLRTRASADARKASELIRDKPAEGVGRIARSAARRLKR
ncbi:hypothetical protein BJ986_002130 [Phycicoccus badiiscoriae]|uniref:Uncharacterized protein n=1 Tax=Pedococcus badiiscoriae TaxID=642776 RepID=A0A852WEJ6_9MICO|nr:hypothetical protein [Pedococcus badiiscoriae]NYG07643.1 hypothetical protein [Pedococcus badiiscoriae]